MNTTWRQCTIGDVCDTISNTYNSNAQQVVLINTSDVLEGKVLNHIYIQSRYLQPIITQYFIGNKSEIWSLSLIVHSKG